MTFFVQRSGEQGFDLLHLFLPQQLKTCFCVLQLFSCSFFRFAQFTFHASFSFCKLLTLLLKLHSGFLLLLSNSILHEFDLGTHIFTEIAHASFLNHISNSVLQHGGRGVFSGVVLFLLQLLVGRLLCVAQLFYATQKNSKIGSGFLYVTQPIYLQELAFL